MGLRDDLLPVIDEIRQLIGDVSQLQLRQSRVWIRRGEWDGGEIHLGSLTNADTEILPRPKVEQISKTTLRVSRITPEYSTGGYSPDDLQPSREAGVDQYYVVAGPNGVLAPYELADKDERKNFGITLILERIDRRNPDDD